MSGLTLRDLAKWGEGWVRNAEERSPDPLDIFDRWHLDTENANVGLIFKRLSRVWQHWAPAQKETLLVTAEAIAHAEEAKAKWNPKAVEGPHKEAMRVARIALEATALAEKLVGLFPPPWDGARAPIGKLVAGLAEFVSGALNATHYAQPGFSIAMARIYLERLKDETPKKFRPASYSLLADLAWLSSGQLLRPDEVTIRRYPDRKSVTGPIANEWRRNWPRLRRISRLAPNRDRHRFDSAIAQTIPPLPHGATKRLTAK